MTTTLVKRPARIAPPFVPVDQITIADPPTQEQTPPAATGMTMIMMPMMSGASRSSSRCPFAATRSSRSAA